MIAKIASSREPTTVRLDNISHRRNMLPPSSSEENLPPALVQIFQNNPDAIRAELAEGLLAPRPYIAPKFLYDALGSKLFEAICELPEYYPTRTEAAIFDAHFDAIATAAGQGTTLIDLGAGNCAKAARLFPVLQPMQYVPVDISIDFLRDAMEALQRRFPGIDMLGLGTDFSNTLALPAQVRRERRLFFYPGSSIGNFMPRQAAAFLRSLREACATEGQEPDGGLLIGVDLVKGKSVLDAAYDDALGVTAAFNLNLLRRLNRLLGADFDLRDWRHRGFFNAAQSRIEMYLEARCSVTVQWREGRRRFVEGERIHTENSYKYTPQEFLALLEESGFGQVRTWTDDRQWFMVCHAKAV
jgi:dimethylhistidine N-methyltransferase